jgi:phosphatidylinositol-3,4,5-trisphosphate 3-phosphatase/dual-specificity protein phosphatase PTEN
VFHCNAGKGRTGTAICAIILYTNLIDDVSNVLRYYAHQRFVGGAGGVTQPCQIRYLEYFHKLIKKQVRSAPPKIFRQMIISSFPASSSDIIDSNVTAEFYQYHFENLVRV